MLIIEIRRYEKFDRPNVFYILKLKLASSFGTRETLVSFLLLKETLSKKLKLIYCYIFISYNWATLNFQHFRVCPVLIKGRCITKNSYT